MTKVIVLTGPESTAKSTLTKEHARHFDGLWFPECAREYLSGRTSGYMYADVEEIARKQIEQYDRALRSCRRLVFLDTWLIITKVWFEWVFEEVPDWLEEAIRTHPVDLFLLCRPDIPWQPDPLRENGGEQRERLFLTYQHELQSRGFRYAGVEGDGDVRTMNAIKAVKLNISP